MGVARKWSQDERDSALAEWQLKGQLDRRDVQFAYADFYLTVLDEVGFATATDRQLHSFVKGVRREIEQLRAGPD